MLEQLLGSVPGLTTGAVRIAAAVGAVVAIVVALASAWSARRISNAHRAYRVALAQSCVGATQTLLRMLHELTQAYQEGSVGKCREIVADLNRQARVEWRVSQDDVFDAAVALFVHRRIEVSVWLQVATYDQPPNIQALSVVVGVDYILEAARILQLAAEAYMFGVRRPRQRVARFIEGIDTTPFSARVLDRARQSREVLDNFDETMRRFVASLERQAG